MPPSSAPRLLDALSLLGVVADELVVRSVRDTHLAWAGRAHGLTEGVAGRVPGALHRGTAGAVYGGLGLGLRSVASGLDRAAAAGLGPELEATRPGRFLAAAVNGLIGDRLLEERPQLAIAMAVRRDEVDVDLERPALAAAFPDAGGRLVLFVHGLCEDETHWARHRERTGTTYGEALAADGWTPVFLRLNTGLPLRENGVALAALAQRLVEEWPVPVERIALVGHSMGGLVVRAAGAVAGGAAVGGPDGVDGAGSAPGDWNALVTDVVTLGTPHLGAPVARGVGHGSRGLARLPETAAFGRILDWRSAGVHDLVAGLTDDVAPLPHARYRLVCATLTSSERHPVGHLVGDLLVQPGSAAGRDRWGGELFPGADVLHVGGADHWALLNHPEVLASLRTWLA
ncbi:alpha/beta hydrolase [Nocardioides dongxiaopingii]|uniref:esterase/lipase family protein n=1 Tax=Nocardioides sp. S-1144 TaxID=2582905 RepID=UPI001165852E|nr:alpha/beta hydrolase [Nocardioides sp. S-1144]QDH10737.1 alpha/beta hydrolase [Nocardioides sp. S-1144]